MRQCIIEMVAVGVAIAGVRESAAERFAVEAYVGKRPAEAAKVMAELCPILERYGYVCAPAELIKRFGERASRPALADAKLTGDTIARRVEEGVNAFVDLEYGRAAFALGMIVEEARANPIVVAREPKVREAMLRGLLYYALASGRSSEEAARAAGSERDPVKKKARAAAAASAAAARDETMTELIRSFPAKVIIAKDYGAEAEQLFQRTRESVAHAGRGRLIVDTTDANAAIYLDEVARGRGSVTIDDLVPGPYRVLVQPATGDAREYIVDVAADRLAHVHADVAIDAFVAVGDWVGLSFPSERDRAREPALLGALVRASSSARIACAFTIGRAGKRITVTGALYGVRDDRLVRRGRVELTGTDDAARLEQLVRYLEGQRAEGIDPR